MTRQEFNRKIDKVVARLSDNTYYSCTLINDYLGYTAKELYSDIFRPSYVAPMRVWVLEDHGKYWNQAILRLGMVELFRQKCLTEKLYENF